MIKQFTYRLLRFTKRKYKIFIRNLRRPVIWGTFRKTNPFSKNFGYDRGTQSVARYYIDCFIEKCSSDIYGNVLEIGDNFYTLKYGKNIFISDVLHVEYGNPKATIVADLSCNNTIPDETYDCLIITQTFQCIYDIREAIKNCIRILKPGGILLATFSGISQISRYDMDRWGEYWRLTSLTVFRLFSEYFDKKYISVNSHGNVLSAIALLEGLASRELRKRELDNHDPDYEVIITIRAVKV